MLARFTRALYSLRGAVTAFVLIPVIALMGVAGWLGLASLERVVNQRMQEDIELVARTLALTISQALENGHVPSVESALRSAGRIELVYGVYVYDQQGRRIASTGNRGAAVHSDDVLRLSLDGENTGEFGRMGDEEIFSYFQPLTDAGGRINGLLQVTRRGSDFENYLHTMRLSAAGLLAVTGGLLALIVFLGHHRAVGRHVERIERAMERVAGGALDHRMPLTGPGELRGLAGGINHMLDGVTRAHREVDRHRLAEAELKQQLAQSEKMAAIGQLAAGVAHELGTPLATVDGHAQRALRENALPEHTRAGLERVRREVQRMEHIVRQLMDFARRNPLRRRPATAQQLVQGALAQLSNERPQDVDRVTVTGKGDGPVLNVDPVRAEQALVNLIRNGLQSGDGARVRVQWFSGDDGGGFVVDDDGPGVPEDTRAHLFEPFFTTKEVGQGTGLGLAVVHSVAEAHQGRIEVDESPLGGARFRLQLEPPRSIGGA